MSGESTLMCLIGNREFQRTLSEKELIKKGVIRFKWFYQRYKKRKKFISKRG